MDKKYWRKPVYTHGDGSLHFEPEKDGDKPSGSFAVDRDGSHLTTG